MVPNRPHISPARKTAVAALAEVRRGSYAEDALRTLLKDVDISAEDRSLATELVYGVLRHRTRLDAILRRRLSRPEKKPAGDIEDILRLAVYQLFLLDRIPDHAAVDQAVGMAREARGTKAGGFVNAVLRATLRERETVETAPTDNPGDLAQYYSHPRNLVELWLARFGANQTRQILEFNNSRPVLTVRVNSLKCGPDELIALWGKNELEASRVEGVPWAVKVTSVNRPVDSLPGYREGLFTVQDSASQLVAPLLDVRPGLRILDACCAPGGKTAHIAALADNRAVITAVDVDEKRLEQTRTNLERLGATGVRFIRGDVTDPEFIQSLGTFDRVLVDAPCTNIGVLRHNPEAKLRFHKDDPRRFAARQLRMLEAATGALGEGSVLLYAVCTVTKEETSDLVQFFLENHPYMEPIPVRSDEVPCEDFIDDRGGLFTFPPTAEHPMDGFFAFRTIASR